MISEELSSSLRFMRIGAFKLASSFAFFLEISFISFRVFLRFSQHLLQVECSYGRLLPREWKKSAFFIIHEHLVHYFLSKFRLETSITI
ncbi:hypothetical protein RIR_jg11360.t1 [Rhizophagus irregularis DAOM 181602=DAOM 197198]|nr:hypothetical protein RIR_jg11360.t1 [Rhizophagus irregularis DAOM 181602=DAOM 197198]